MFIEQVQLGPALSELRFAAYKLSIRRLTVSKRMPGAAFLFSSLSDTILARQAHPEWYPHRGDFKLCQRFQIMKSWGFFISGESSI
jgi:hypothetical protein